MWVVKWTVLKTQSLNFIKKGLQHCRFTVKCVRFLRAPILKNICKRLLLSRPMFLFYAFWKHYFLDFFLFLFYFLIMNLWSSLIILMSEAEKLEFANLIVFSWIKEKKINQSIKERKRSPPAH